MKSPNTVGSILVLVVLMMQGSVAELRCTAQVQATAPAATVG